MASMSKFSEPNAICACFGNTARLQQLQNSTQTLCCWCFNRERLRINTETSAHWPTDIELDVAEHYPDLVSPNCASLRPSIGPGWSIILDQFLRSVETDPEFSKSPPGHLQISDVKTTMAGEISIGWHWYFDWVEPYEERLENLSAITCCLCGHQGDIVRQGNRSEPLCGFCQMPPRKA